jgi:hypothetical protein
VNLSVAPYWGFLMPRAGRFGADPRHFQCVYVNVSHGSSSPQSSRGDTRVSTVRLTPEEPPALVGEEVNLAQHDLDILALLLEIGPAPLQPGEEFLELFMFAARDIV